MQKNQQKRPYTAPVVTMVDFAVERGFDVSDPITTSVELNEALLQGYTDGQLFQEMSMQNGWSTGWGGYSGQASNGGYFGYGWSNGDDGFWGH